MENDSLDYVEQVKLQTNSFPLLPSIEVLFIWLVFNVALKNISTAVENDPLHSAEQVKLQVNSFPLL